MANTVAPQPVLASMFHAGNTCPFCQEAIATSQLIIACPQCGSFHHETCWLNKKGCSSYHCDVSVRSTSATARPDITINADELKNVYVPPPAPKRSGQEVAASFLPKPPTRRSRLAIASVIVGAMGFVGIAGALTGSAPMLSLGIVFSLGAIVLGVLSMLFIVNTENRIYGMGLAGTGIGAPAILIMVFFATLGSQAQHPKRHVNINVEENLPTEAQLAQMSAPTSNAMVANVVIKSSGGFLGETSLGSGIIMRVENRRAVIITNKHVIGDNKDGINVTFYNGEVSTASVEWRAPGDIDIAILSCQALSLDKYKPVHVAENAVAPGEKVFAVGNPMGLSWTYTEGTISSLRAGQGGAKNVDLYQTQTPINSGNSGGGLYTMSGELIGVNTLTQDKSVAEGLSFAIAIRGVLNMLSAEERVKLLGK